ncbi:DEAD/DEAH box helicase [Mesorhizobium sp. RP14(2022)]|uniref:DEAD/DEAH box helicase n=1 Tax=Mesorhizobium liriopis TaxID=2953882 RepID=A0ABT1C1U3_9HYPH|nr:DEAD/DEAH box helicase [Mesorhizobium liriopis]MCO6048727.1 DEAD/DEAH box helicase [Mesorhizobium liriopis]
MTEENTIEAQAEATGFARFALPAVVLKALDAAGFAEPKPIQDQAIGPQLEGRDILGIAQTGSGKTAAFALPILSKIMALGTKRRPKTARALILVPTRELAVQIEETFRLLSKGAHISTALVLGGVSRFSQVKKIAPGVDVLIATPGRLHDLVQTNDCVLADTKWLVLDEADRMLDMGFIHQVKRLAKATARDRQTALFSATMPGEIAELAEGLLHMPVRVEVAPQGTTAGEIEQSVIMARIKQKRMLLTELLRDEAMKSVIVFARTKHGADRVARDLERDGIEAGVIHGNKSQNARQKALNSFRDGSVRILVATDIAARGIDVPGITHVVNFDLPDEAESYVHRIGRTGRNGASGVAITLCEPAENAKLRAVEKVIRKKLSVTRDVTGEPDPAQPRNPQNHAPRGEQTERSERSERPRQNQQRHKPRSGGNGGGERPRFGGGENKPAHAHDGQPSRNNAGKPKRFRPNRAPRRRPAKAA